MRKLLIFFMLFHVPSILFGSDFFKVKNIPDNVKVHYVLVDSGTYTPQTALNYLSQNKGIAANESSLNLGFHDLKDLWLLIDIESSPSFDGDNTLYIDNLHLDKLWFYKVVDNTPVLEALNGDWVKNSQKKYKSVVPYIPIEREGKWLVKIYKDHSSFIVPICITSTTDFNKKLWLRELRNGLYIGVLLISLFLGLGFYVMVGERVMLVYAMYSFITILYLSVNFGVTLEYIYPEYPKLNNYFRAYCAIASALFFMAFSLQLLPLKEKLPKLFKIINTSFFSLVAILLLSIVFNGFMQTHFNIIFKFIYILFAIVFTGLFIGALKLSWSKVFIARIYLLAYTLLILGIGILIIREMGWLLDYWLVNNLVWTAILIELFILMLALAYQMRLVLLEKLELSRLVVSQQRQLFTRFFEGREEERKNISSDLHEGIAGNLLAAQYAVDKHEQKKLYNLLKETFQEIRQLSHDLYPPHLKEESLAHVLENFKDRYASHFTLNVDVLGETQALGETKKLMVFRFAQELINNSVKHSNATLVSLELRCENNTCTLIVTDNGKGMSNIETDGIGLRSIKARLDEYPGSSIQIEHPKKGGVSVCIRIPYGYD